ncbi:MAG: hypothetical protein IJH78_02175 [Clostridia bacterium]|nr:hypothetical protein [Clostridia bacterium]
MGNGKMRKISLLVLSAIMGLTDIGGAKAETAAAGPGTADQGDEIREIISHMTPEQKLAQMMIVALRSDGANKRSATAVDRSCADLLRKYGFGGIILFSGNIVDVPQTVSLIHDAQAAAAGSEAGIPMFICVDQEGGMVNRVSFGTASPGSMALAAAGDVSLTEESAKMLGDEIAALGFNMDFAPVSDVNSNPANPVIGVRAFSDDPAVVSRSVTAFIKGLHAAGISSALKHFPGHGNVAEDSHTHLPCSDLSLDELRKCDLVPFRAGIRAGIDMIMTAHIQYPRIERETYVSIQDGREVHLPATLSHTIITDLLRKEMGYDGVVITDAMEMEAIASHFDPIDASVLAINAGVDILLCPVDLYKDGETDTFLRMEAYMTGLLERFGAGDISEEELDDSVFRILKLKREKGLSIGWRLPSAEEQAARAKAAVGTAEHHAREWKIAQAGMTLLKNENAALPLGKGDPVLILYPTKSRSASVEYAVARLAREGLADPSRITRMCYSALSAENADLRKALSGAEAVVILSQSVSRNEEMVRVIDMAHEGGKAAVLLSLNLPYDAACYENADAVLCAYQPYGSAHDEEGNGPFNLNVAVALCTAFGQSVPTGTLPVNVPRITVSGEGIVFEDELLYERWAGLQGFGN